VRSVTVTSVEIGRRLREVRRRAGLTLQGVQALSNDEFRASALAAYERGDRAISLIRMLRLAELYSVPPVELLPTAPARELDLADIERAERRATRFVVDVDELGAIEEEDARALLAFALEVRARRHTENPLVSLRARDLDGLAAALGRSRTALERYERPR
jgi:transcriptional regulator with XRE-family HTH domain